jgi:hypothetical protein
MKIIACFAMSLFLSAFSQIGYGATTVSLITLLSNPERFDGKELRTEGYFVAHDSTLYIYPYSEDARYLSFTNCFVIETTKNTDFADAQTYARANHHHVVLQGYFSASDRGDMGAYAGSFHQIAELRVKEPKKI